MSLLIVGSCSRATQGIVAQLAKQQLYQSITILDLLPTYDLHQRFYRLKQNLSSLNSNTQVNINKLINIEELASNINSHKDLLFVTHDYFTSVTSKTKLMEITAQLSKQKNAVFATPLEYDHFGEKDPEAAFRTSQLTASQLNPNATFIRSDIQNELEFLAYLHHPKNFIEERTSTIPSSFKPKVVSSNLFNEAVISALQGGQKGQTQILTGQQQDPLSVAYNKDIELDQTRHHSQNACNLMKKYKCLSGRVQKTA